MEPWKKEVNLEWINQMKRVVKEGGVWVWPDTGHKYILQDGEFVGTTDEAVEALKEILP